MTAPCGLCCPLDEGLVTVLDGQWAILALTMCSVSAHATERSNLPCMDSPTIHTARSIAAAGLTQSRCERLDRWMHAVTS